MSDKERIEELESAVKWALGEGDSNFGDNIPDGVPINKFWWRSELRARAFPPKFEEVEIKRWGIIDEHGLFFPETYTTEGEIFVGPRSKVLKRGKCQIVELSGHYKRPIVPKVKKRIEIMRPINPDCAGFPAGTKFYAELPE